MKTASKIILIALLSTATAIAILLITLFIQTRNFISGPGLQQLLSEKISTPLKVNGQLLPLNIEETHITSQGYAAKGSPESIITEIFTENISAQVQWKPLLQQRLIIDSVSIEKSRLSLRELSALNPSDLSIPSLPENSATGNSWLSSFHPKKIEIRHIILKDLSLTLPLKPSGKSHLTLNNIELHLEPITNLHDNATSWKIYGKNGTVTLPHPDQQNQTNPLNLTATIDFFTLSTSPSEMKLTDLKLNLKDGGTLQTSGTILLPTPTSPLEAKLNYQAEKINTTPWLTEDWKARLTATIDSKGTFTYKNSSPALQGTIKSTDSTLQGLPILHEIASITRLQDFLTLRLHQAESSYTWTPDNLSLTDLTLESSSLLKITGNTRIIQKKLSGLLEIGTIDSALTYIPGAKSQVFTRESPPYRWASPAMTLSGSTDNIKEDLTPRLKNAGLDALTDATFKSIEGLRNGELTPGTEAVKEAIETVTPLLPELLPSFP